jgi:hypothetical protein
MLVVLVCSGWAVVQGENATEPHLPVDPGAERVHVRREDVDLRLQ